MLVFGTAISDEEQYRRHARPGIARVAEPDSIVLERRGTSLQAAYNGMLDEAAAIDGLEALVLGHQDLELRDTRFAETVRRVLADPEVGLLGAAGARGVRSLLWSSGQIVGGWAVGRDGATEEVRHIDPGPGTEVDAVDGILLVLSPWAVREVRFDPRFERWFHGYDVDFSFEVRARGRRAVVVDLDLVHWTERSALDPLDDWVEAACLWHEKWDPDGAPSGFGPVALQPAYDARRAVGPERRPPATVRELDPLALELTGLDRDDLRSLRIHFTTTPATPEEIVGDRDERRAGRDLPLDASTMTGLVRLLDLRACVEELLRDGVPGDLIETGVWRGGSALYMRAILAAHGDEERSVWLADSFAGLPEPAGVDDWPATQVPDFNDLLLTVPRADVEGLFARHALLDRRVRFVEGWFADTLGALGDETWSLIRLDGDWYSSTMEALEALYPRLSPGGYCVIDDYALPGCRSAVDDFRAAHGITEPITTIDWSGARWRKRVS
jgi:O-methyltransferase